MSAAGKDSDEQPVRGITRRAALGGAAAAGVGAVLPGSAAADDRKGLMRRADVVVVGAGLAGLVAAWNVVRGGRSAIVLEARDRVGGRLLNRSIGGGDVVEIGGQWIGPTQERIAALARDVGVDTFKTYNAGDYIYYRNGTATRYQNLGPPFGAIPPDPAGAAEAFAALGKLDEMARTVPRDKPWEAPDAEEWDGKTFETWKRENAQTDSGRLLLDVAIEAVFACEPKDLSLLFALAYFNSPPDTPQDTEPGGSKINSRFVTTEGGAQDSRFVGGAQTVALRLARRLVDRIHLGTPVRRIEQAGAGVVVHSDRLGVEGKRVIVTVPPAVGASIDFLPKLPARRAQLLQRFPQGSVIKCHAVYDSAFWRENGLAGQVVSDAHPIRVTFDNSPPSGSPGVMLGFMEGHDARFYARRTPAERRAAVLANFALYFGEEALSPRQYFEMDWSTERWTRGCYVGYMPPGVMTEYGPAVREPFDRVHWAGAETATVWNGYMDGAVQSGERAAREVLERL